MKKQKKEPKLFLTKRFDNAPSELVARQFSHWSIHDSIEDAVSSCEGEDDNTLEQIAGKGAIVYEADPKLLGTYEIYLAYRKLK